jgi:hypothetical protein
MPSKHPNAAQLIKRGLYDDLESFSQLEQRIMTSSDYHNYIIHSCFFRARLVSSPFTGLRATGRKSFTLDYILEGRRQRLNIGDFPDWSTNTVQNRRNTRKDRWHLLRRHDDAIGPERHFSAAQKNVGRWVSTGSASRAGSAFEVM